MFKELVLASNNQGKILEFQNMAQDLSWNFVSQSDFNTPEAEETGLSFIENAIIKARNASRFSGLPALADDSGLEVLALQGEPGIFSARFAGTDANDADNRQLLLEKMRDVPEKSRQANFRCCLALVRYENDPCPIIGEGIWQGSIAFDEKGNNGFGYDSLFIVGDLACRSAELAPENKNRISHRALAFQSLVKQVHLLNA